MGPAVELSTFSGPIHVGVVVKDMDSTIQFLQSNLGIGPWRTWERHYSREQVTVGEGPFSFRVAFASLGPIEMELIEVLEGNTTHARFLETHGEGLHHIGFRVPDMKAVAARLQERGVDILQSGVREDGGHVYMDSARTGGVIFEFSQRSAPR
ncbi:MAG: VOC family protein [Chloroflexi bacterium]|nr:VOC family protein [Chloroflexota bacterium]